MDAKVDTDMREDAAPVEPPPDDGEPEGLDPDWVPVPVGAAVPSGDTDGVELIGRPLDHITPRLTSKHIPISLLENLDV